MGCPYRLICRARQPPVPLRVCVHGPAGRTWPDLSGLRILLVADVLTRIADLQGLETITVRGPRRGRPLTRSQSSIGPRATILRAAVAYPGIY